MYDLDACEYCYDDNETVVDPLFVLADRIQEIKQVIKEITSDDDLDRIAKVLDFDEYDEEEIQYNLEIQLQALELELEDLESEFDARSDGLTLEDYDY